MEFESTCCGIPCRIRVTYWEPYRPAFISGPPEDCYPAEGGDGEWQILDRRGRPASWLEKKLSQNKNEMRRLSERVFDFMENARC